MLIGYDIPVGSFDVTRKLHSVQCWQYEQKHMSLDVCCAGLVDNVDNFRLLHKQAESAVVLDILFATMKTLL